ncbi:MAG: PilZ domain-containing protein [Nitrospinae bacterium]|nr:PilZ domain-containing protein [Nitrospinota bacterium]MBI3814105.1 PilZ domain-containing protein [Nitrospinota bacterium]
MNENKPKFDYAAAREYVRVDTSFPLKFSVISAEEYKLKRELYLKSRTVNRVETAAQPVQVSPADAVDMDILKDMDPDLARIWIFQIRMLVSIEKKLDGIADIIKGSEACKENGFCDGKCRDMSGSGIAFYGSRQLNKDDIVEIKMSLPKLPPIPINIIGMVVKCEAFSGIEIKEGKYLTAVKFAAINEEDREEIVRFVLERQREQIKAMKRL